MITPNSFFVIGNWKMKPATRPEAVGIVKKLVGASKKSVEVVVCPPSIFYSDVTGAAPARVSFGVQNVSTEPSCSSMTGEISAQQAVSMGAQYAIVGHSSRRAAGESDAQVNEKIRACLAQNIIPIVCIGEKERDPSGEYINELRAQIQASFADLEKQDFEHIIIAYEPLWAIGAAAKREATEAETQEVRILIQKTINELTGNIPLGRIAIIYGGSVSSAAEVATYARAGMRGVLVGRASLDPIIFNALVAGAESL